MHKIQQKRELKASGGRITGTGVVRDKHGNIKGTITFEGTTPLTKEEVEKKLEIPVEEVPNGTDPHSSGT